MNQYNMHGMIQNGAFGVSSPINQSGFNPYNNMIPFGGYQQQVPQQQYQYYNNPYIQQPQNNNSYIFQPIGGYIQQQSPYGNNQYNYYNPYGNTFSNNQYGGNIGYGNAYSYTNGYNPIYSPVAIEQYQKQQVELFKIKYRLANYYVGNDIDEDYLDKMCNPQNPANVKTEEQIKEEENFRYIKHISDIANGRIQVPKSRAQIEADMLNLMSYNMHKALDDHSLCQFLEEDLWRLQREEWIRQNINVNGNRDLSAVYNSSDFNELLKLHNSSSNPYVNELLNTSKYDNNLDDIEVGMQMAFERERRRKAILEGKVPSFISNDETIKRRHEWTKQIMEKMYSKGSCNNV